MSRNNDLLNVSTIIDSNGRKKKKWANPHKRDYGIEIVKRKEFELSDSLELPKYSLSIDIGITTSGLTFFDQEKKIVESLYYKKDEDSKVKGARIVYLTQLCEQTWQKYLELIHEMDSLNLMEVYYKTRENRYRIIFFIIIKNY